jgi:hypothetical protein
MVGEQHVGTKVSLANGAEHETPLALHLPV